MTEYVAIAVSVLTLLILVLEKTFGGGNSLANKFAQLDKDTTAAISLLRADLNAKVDLYEDNYAVGLDSIKSNIHAMQVGLLEFRAKMAEEYVHKADHSAGLIDLKRDVREGFDRVEKRLTRIEDSQSKD